MFQVGEVLTTKELVSKMGITESTWKKAGNKEKYLANLSKYVDYTVKKVGTSIVYTIENVKGEYTKPPRIPKKVYNAVLDKFEDYWHNNEPETATRVASKMRKDNIGETKSVATLENVVGQVRTELYGKPNTSKIKNPRGTLGSCRYVRAKLYRNQSEPVNGATWDKTLYCYEPLTAEDYEIYN